MGILLAFAPFIVFAIADQFIGVTNSLIVGAVISAGLLLRDWLVARKSPKVLEIGTTLLFGGLAIYAAVFSPAWPLFLVRLFIDSGLLAIVLVSLAIRLPFTLQYAREQAPREVWDRPEFIRINYVITAVWGVAFAAMVGADVVLVYVSALPSWVGIAVTVAAIVGAVVFTGKYPARVQAKAEAAARAGEAATGA